MTLTDSMNLQARDARRPQTTRHWSAAFKALKRLLADKEDTVQVFEIMRAMNGGTSEKNFRRLLETHEGGRIAYEHVELAPMLMDDAWLDSFPTGSVGAAYREFIRSENLSAEGLADISRQRQSTVEEQHPYAWFGRRTRDSHDIWHILTGYHRDALGEACLVAFSYAQTRGLGWAVIAFGAIASALQSGHTAHARAIWQGYRRGVKAKWLPGEDYIALLHEPLDGARRRLNITAPMLYDAIPQTERNA